VSRTQPILDMHPYDASDYVCRLLGIPPQETEDLGRPTFLVYVWGPDKTQLDVHSIAAKLHSLTAGEHWHAVCEDVDGEHSDFLWAAYWTDDRVGGVDSVQLYEDAVDAARYVWESLRYQHSGSDLQLTRAAIGMTPYSALCGLRLECGENLDIEDCERGQLIRVGQRD